MALVFYPKSGDLDNLSMKDKLETLLSAAEQFKAHVLDTLKKGESTEPKNTPRDLLYAFNWDDLAKMLREIRDYPENNINNRTLKAENLLKLAEVYEVLRGAKMAKLEAVRLALVNEANQLRSNPAA